MSGTESFPPPGLPPPAAPGRSPGSPPPGPGWQPGPPPGGPQGPHEPFRGAAHKPGAIPLRPLTLGDMYDAALKIIRFNPKATVGSAVLVTAVAMAIPVLLTTVVTLGLDISLDQEATDFSTEEAVGMIASAGSLVLGLALQGVGLILVTGMVAHVAAAAAIGRRLSLGEAWALTRGKRWRLIGLMLLVTLMTLALFAVYTLAWVAVVVALDGAAVVIFGVVTVPLFLAALFWFWIRVYYLPVPALMLEPVGVTGAIARGYRLTKRAFWRTFGIALLTNIVAQVAASVLSFPIGIVGGLAPAAGVDDRYAFLILVITQALSSVLAAAFVGPFTSAVTSIQYLDQRIRKEAYDVELMTRAGIAAS